MAHSSLDELRGILRSAQHVLPLFNYGWIEMGYVGRSLRAVRLWPV
jgi:hypothetical protein